MKIRAQQQAGLTRWEVATLGICAVALMVFVILPLALTRFSVSRHRHGHNPQMHCVNNLKQVGLAFRLWANDYGGEYPFASTNADSSLAWVNSPETFRHFQVLSNELVTPKILICRADQARRVATNFHEFSNTNLSYFVGLDAREDAPQSILSGDRNITGGTLSNGFLRVLTPGAAVAWTKEIHQNAGNLALGDGSVRQVLSEQLRQHLAGMTNAVIRLAVP